MTKEPLVFPASGKDFMYHSVSRKENKVRMTGWVNPKLKPAVGDLIQGNFLDGMPVTICIDEIKYTNHPGIFGKYEIKTAEDSDKKKRMTIVDLEPNHPNKIESRFEAICHIQ